MLIALLLKRAEAYPRSQRRLGLGVDVLHGERGVDDRDRAHHAEVIVDANDESCKTKRSINEFVR